MNSITDVYKIIGKNHVNWIPNYRYKAWYKAKNKIVIGASVTPKTDIGDFIIESTGEVTVYACKEIHIPTNFHAQPGGVFHAYIHCDGCYRTEGKPENTNESENNENLEEDISQYQLNTKDFEGAVHPELQIYPNPTTGELTILFPEGHGIFEIVDLNGGIMNENASVPETKRTTLRLPQGMYLLRWQGVQGVLTKKISVL